MECPICLGPLSSCPDGIEDSIRRRLTKIRKATCCCTPCGHIFHKACLLRWLDQSNRPPCPVCNVKLSKMKLYPAYLNVDKKDDTGMDKRNDDTSSNIEGVDLSPFTRMVPPSKSKQIRLRGSSVTAQATVGTSQMSHNAPTASGQATTVMTFGAYALTTFGPGPMMMTAAAVGIGAPPGVTIPRAHPHPQLGHVELQSSAYIAFPQSTLSLPTSIPLSTLPAFENRRVAHEEWRTRSTNNSVPTRSHTVNRNGLIGLEPSHTLWPGLDYRTISLPSSYHNGASLAEMNPNINIIHPHRVDLGTGGNSRYHPYRQPPPAHSTSSLGRTIDQQGFNYTMAQVLNCNANETSNAEAASGRERRASNIGLPEMYVHSSDVDGLPAQTEP